MLRRRRPEREPSQPVRRRHRLASSPHRCGFLALPLPPPKPRSSPFRPVAAGSYSHPRDALGLKAFHAHRGTSAVAGIGGIARPAFPEIVPEIVPAIE